MLKIIITSVLLIIMVGCGRESRSGTQELIGASQDGYEGVKYISVGDSTRAESWHEGQYLFYELYRELAKSGVTSRLMARDGQSLSHFNHGDAYPTTGDVIGAIDGEGENTIVDISLGINDIAQSRERIKTNLTQAVQKIQRYRPQTRIVLTTPTRLYYDGGHTQMLRDIYHEVANEQGLGLNATIDDLMPSHDATPASWYLGDGVHLSAQGQHQVAQFILGNMRGY